MTNFEDWLQSISDITSSTDLIENRDQLIGLLSTTSGYADKHPLEAEEILQVLEAAGLMVVRKSSLKPLP